MDAQDRQILVLLSQGRTMPQAAGDMGLSVWRVRERIVSLRREYNARTTTSLVAFAAANGYLREAV